MAVITTSTKAGSDKFFQRVTSGAAGLTDSVELTGLEGGLTHCFLGVKMFDVSGDPVVATAGTFTVKVRTVNTGQWEDPPVKTIDATAPETISFAGNIDGVKVTVAALATVTTWRAVLTCNRR